MSNQKFYLTNSALISGIILSIILMFVVQFKVESLQDEIANAENEIASYQDQIQFLEVEWVYLTRPERLRTLATNYLQNNGYALASPIKNVDDLEKYYLATYEKTEVDKLALGDESKEAPTISF
jgi:cell division protein FtsL